MIPLINNRSTTDKYLNMVQDMGQPLLNGHEKSIEIETQLLHIEKILNGIFYRKKKKISLAIFVLDDEAKINLGVCPI